MFRTPQICATVQIFSRRCIQIWADLKLRLEHLSDMHKVLGLTPSIVFIHSYMPDIHNVVNQIRKSQRIF